MGGRTGGEAGGGDGGGGGVPPSCVAGECGGNSHGLEGLCAVGESTEDFYVEDRPKSIEAGNFTLTSKMFIILNLPHDTSIYRNLATPLMIFMGAVKEDSSS